MVSERSVSTVEEKLRQIGWDAFYEDIVKVCDGDAKEADGLIVEALENLIGQKHA